MPWQETYRSYVSNLPLEAPLISPLVVRITHHVPFEPNRQNQPGNFSQFFYVHAVSQSAVRKQAAIMVE